MRNFTSMLKKAKEAQDKLAEVKKELAEIVCVGEAAGGVIKVEVTGDGRIISIRIHPDAAGASQADDIRMLEDLIIVATRDAQDKAAAIKADLMKQVTGDLPLPPGLDLPI
ncbi:YbaB/EbfC family nucleoid-associated protein [Alphaproteobacteria bacterium]|jgi:DNA-binding YbaB/EbfC family protein|nr:YbaB/EbfC family nucleoid-associated protein [Alphaproteobacteria bacterium]